MRKLLLAVALLVAFCTPAFAQSALPKVPQGASVTIAADHASGAIASGYRLYVDSAQLGNDYAASSWDAVSQVVTVKSMPITASVGTHTIGLSAFNASGESAPVTLQVDVVVPVPGSPTNLRIVGTLQADGTIRWTVEPATGQ